MSDNTVMPDNSSVHQTLSVIDSIPFPLTRGTWWKYQRFDTTASNNYTGAPKIIVDTSTELITVLGKITITDSVQATMLEVKNLTLNKKDTNYIFYYRNNFIVSVSFPQNVSVYAEDKYLGAYDLRFRLPLSEGQYLIPNSTNKGDCSCITDLVRVKKDTTVSVLNKSYSGCSYVTEKYNYFGGAYSNGGNSQCVLVKNIGFAFWLAEVNISNHYGLFTNKAFIRRLVDYYIVP